MAPHENSMSQRMPQVLEHLGRKSTRRMPSELRLIANANREHVIARPWTRGIHTTLQQENNVVRHNMGGRGISRRRSGVKDGNEHSPRLSSAFSTISNPWNHSISYWGSFMLPWIGVIWTLGLNGAAVCAATCKTLKKVRIRYARYISSEYAPRLYSA